MGQSWVDLVLMGTVGVLTLANVYVSTEPVQLLVAAASIWVSFICGGCSVIFDRSQNQK